MMKKHENNIIMKEGYVRRNNGKIYGMYQASNEVVKLERMGDERS